MHNLLKRSIAGMLIALLLSGCSDRGESEVKAVQGILEDLASGKKPTDFAGFEGEAVAKLRQVKKSHAGSIIYDIRSGDAPDHGDGSCDYHVLVTKSGDSIPFIGILMKNMSDGWHIAGYWTPE